MTGIRGEILDSILQAQDAGTELDLQELKQRFPGHEAEVERLALAARRYELGVPAVAEPCGVKPGDRIGDYLVECLLGRGGMGQVFLARQLSLGQRQVALKVLPGALRNDANLLRFEREAVLSAELHHPCLAEVYGFGEEQGVRYIAMRFVQGNTIHELLRGLSSGRLSLTDRELSEHVLRWATDVANALAVVHGAGLMHRDVKPSNILIECLETDSDPFSGVAVLVDFGLVRAVDATERTQTGYSAATPAYASPEQLLQLEVDPSSDVYSLGVTLHDLLTRRLPAERGQATAGLEPLEVICPGIDLNLAAVVGKMMANDPRWRYSDASALLLDLRALAAGKIVSARFPSASERFRLWAYREPTRILRAGVALVVFVGLVVLGVYGADRVSEASQVSAAWKAGDLSALGPAAVAMAPSSAWLIQDSALEASLEALRDKTGSSLLSQAANALRTGNQSAALLLAATPLRMEGLRGDPFMRRFLLSSLEREGNAREPGRDRSVDALRVVSRLFFERPVETLVDSESSEAFRAVLLDRWSSGHLPDHERLLLITTFSGLGKAEDLRWILEWSKTRPLLSEETRFAFFVAERILRRAIVLDHPLSIEHEELHRIVIDRVTPAFRVQYGELMEIASRSRVGAAAVALATGLGVFRRHHGLPPDLGASYPEIGAAGGWAGNVLALFVRCANQDPGLNSDLEQGRYLGRLDPPRFMRWGVRCGLYGEPIDLHAVRSAAKARVAALSAALKVDCLAELERGLVIGREQLSGILHRNDPDENTRLGANAVGADWIDCATEDVPLAEPDAESKVDTVARWSAGKQSISIGGAMLSVGGRFIGQAMDERWRGYILMPLPGHSEIEMKFRIEDPFSTKDWSIVVRYQVGARAYLPYQGDASMELFIDGKPLDEGRLLFPRDVADYELGLPWEVLTPGDHTLSLRLGANSNTTFRVHSVTLRAPK